MIRDLSMAGLTILVASVAFGQTQAGQSTEARIQQTLRRASEEWAKVPITRDTSVLRRIWASDFVYVEASGRVFNKVQGIADVSKITDAYTGADLSNLNIRIYGGNVAIVIGDDRETGRDKDGKPFDRKSRFTNVWVLQNGSWQCVSGHSSDLPSK